MTIAELPGVAAVRIPHDARHAVLEFRGHAPRVQVPGFSDVLVGVTDESPHDRLLFSDRAINYHHIWRLSTGPAKNSVLRILGSAECRGCTRRISLGQARHSAAGETEPYAARR